MFKKFKTFVEKQSSCVIKTLRTDNGGEFFSSDFDASCEELGIYKQLTTLYTPDQNIAERKNRTVVDMARSMLYSLQSKAYRLYNPISGKIIISRYVLFNEAACSSSSSNTEGTPVPLIKDSEVPGSQGVVAHSPPSSSPRSPIQTRTPTADSPTTTSSSSSSETPPKKCRSLKDIYETCDFALSVYDPFFYLMLQKK